MYEPYVTELGEQLPPQRDAMIQAANDAPRPDGGERLSLDLTADLPSHVVRATLDAQERRQRLDLEQIAHWKRVWGLDAPGTSTPTAHPPR